MDRAETSLIIEEQQLSPPSVAQRNLNIEVRSSRLLRWFMVLTHATALIILWSMLWPWWLCALITVVVLASAAVNWRRHQWRGVRLLQYTDGRWYCVENDKSREMRLTGELFVTTWMIVMRLQLLPGSRKTHWVLLPDSADPQSLRRLRVLLRYGLSPG